MGHQYLNPTFSGFAHGGLASIPKKFSNGGMPTMVSNQSVTPTTYYDHGIPAFSGQTHGSLVSQPKRGDRTGVSGNSTFNDITDFFTRPSIEFAPREELPVNNLGPNAQYVPGQPHQESLLGLPAYMLQEAGRYVGANRTPDPRQGMYLPGDTDVSQAYSVDARGMTHNVPSTQTNVAEDNSYAHGGEIYNLGSYSDGGRLLKGPGDGMSDNIPATIGHKQPARLADGEFVIPADVVSHLGNGSTEAGSKVLYKMMERVRKARTGNPKQGKQIKANNYMPA